MSVTIAQCPERELLVYGPRKAGTTLLQSLLDGGGTIHMMPGELRINLLTREELSPAEFRDRYFRSGRTYFSGLVDPDGGGGVAPDYSLQPLSEEQTRDFFDTRGYNRLARELLEGPPPSPEVLLRRDVAAFLSSSRQPRGSYTYWASKEVGGDPSRVVRNFRRMFPSGRVVYLVRDPRFIVRSIVRDRKKRGTPQTPRGVFYECREAQRLIRYAYEEAVGREVVVSYEEMTADPAAAMEGVARQLGIPFEEVLTYPTTLGLPVVVRTSSRATTTVFRGDDDWTKDLEPWEVAIIRWFHALAPTIYRLAGQRYVQYHELQKRLAEQGRRAGAFGHG